MTNLRADFVVAQLAICLAGYVATRLHLYWPGCVSKHTEKHAGWKSFREETTESTHLQLIAARVSFL